MPDERDISAGGLSMPRPSDEDTADLPVVDLTQAHASDLHEQPTLPLPEESRSQRPPSDPRNTLVGSGGLDPNPDFLNESEMTMPHVVPFQHTQVHVPNQAGGRQVVPPRPAQTKPLPPEQPSVPRPVASYNTMQNNQSPQRQPPQVTQPNQRPVPYQQNYQQPQQQYPPQGNYQQPPPGNQPPLPPRRKPLPRKILGCPAGCFMIVAGLLVTFCGGMSLITLLLSVTLGAQLEERLQEQISGIDNYQNFQSTFYYDRDGDTLYEVFNEGRRTNIEFEQFPQVLIDATIAVEDDTFWTNPGFEVQATTRAFLQYVGVNSGSTGGSTITQQVVRNVLFDYEYRTERSVQRKFEEIILATLLNSRRTKQEVLTLYLNEIYYGSLAYGAEAAAQTFFDKTAAELTLGEAALLAGLPQAPGSLDPLNPDPEVQEAVYERWQIVLDRMVAEGYITQQQRDETLQAGLVFAPSDIPLRAPHFTVYARQELEALMVEIGYTPEDVARGGLQVYTTLDLQMNDMVQQAAANQVANLAGNNVTNAAVLVMQPVTGEILAMVGSVDYNNDAIDGQVNVTISERQPGSTMKPFTYSAAMELGMTPGDVIWDTPVNIDGYIPRNYDGAFHGPMRMRTALANSYNIPAVQTLRTIGVPQLLSFLDRFGVDSLGQDASLYGVSLTLGGGEMTLLELTRGYTVFANQGVLVPSTAILCVLDQDDNILYQYENSCPKGNTTDRTVNRAGYGTQVLDPRIAFVMTDILSDNNARSTAMGSNSPLYTPGFPSAVKTGTTNDIKDNWTVGYTRNVIVGVWVGNSNGDPMVNSSGLTGAAPIWNSVITNIYSNASFLNQFGVNGSLLPDRADPPAGMSLRQLCDIRSLRDPATDCAGGAQEWMLDGPAGIPDGSGNFQFPQGQQVSNDRPAAGPWLQELSPDIYRVRVQPIPPEVAAGIQFTVPGGQAAPLAPLYCQVPVEAEASSPGARDQVFIGPPQFPDDAVQAEQYARSNGLPFLPSIACDATLLSIGPVGPVVITAVITQPTPGQTITEGIPILGTVQFGPDQAVYYKLELSGGQFGGDWVTIGETHSNSVVNGQLEFLPGTPGLSPGDYQVRLVVVGLDGNFVQPPYTVPFRVQ